MQTGSLERLRFPAAASRGRRYPEASHPFRTEFQRDRDRVIHSRAFRRLEDKTQVFTAGLSDHFRNRLTHTIEVAQIARTVARALALDEDLTEALALAHDVGHPPFAHAGEEALNRQMGLYGGQFDHNLHALRVVECFEQRYAAFPGLNLTFEVREGVVKHSRDFEPGELPELDEYLPGLRPVLEAQLIDLADEAAYNTADLDDAYSAGIFTLSELCASVPHCAALREEVETQYPGATERARFQELLRRLIDWLVSGLIAGTHAAADEAGVKDFDDVRRFPRRLARYQAQAQAANAALKRFLHERVYHSAELVDERRRSAAAIAELFAFFMAHPGRLPGGFREQSAGAPLHRVVCDYIAGMTDGFFWKTHQSALGS